MDMQRCHGQQADSDLKTASLSLVYTAMVPVRVDTKTPQRIQDFTGAPMADTEVTVALGWSKLSCQRGCLNHPPTLRCQHQVLISCVLLLKRQ